MIGEGTVILVKESILSCFAFVKFGGTGITSEVLLSFEAAHETIANTIDNRQKTLHFLLNLFIYDFLKALFSKV